MEILLNINLGELYYDNKKIVNNNLEYNITDNFL